jgi:carbohydrate kinase (thermoresistant glucokinase family)
MSGTAGLPNLVLIVMGVSGAGKSTIAEALDARLHWPFQEGDDLHPPANIQKMHAGIPLDDTDRAPWLAACKAWIDARVARGEPGFITCSALKRKYRDYLTESRPNVRVLYLRASREILEEHVHERTGHFMPPSLLDSQLATLEEPTPDENPIVVNVESTVERTADEAIIAIRAAAAAASQPAPAG